MNGAEENEGRTRRVGGWGDNTPIFDGNEGDLGSKRGRTIPALVKASRLVSWCQQAGHQCVTAEFNLSQPQCLSL